LSERRAPRRADELLVRGLRRARGHAAREAGSQGIPRLRRAHARRRAVRGRVPRRRRERHALPGDAPVKIDGTQIAAILDIAGAPKKKSPKVADDLERTLGLKLATETRKFLERPVELYHPDAEDPGVKDESFAGKLPDVGAWIEQLGKNREGLRQCVHHFLGLYPIGQELQYGDMMVAMIVLEAFTP